MRRFVILAIATCATAVSLAGPAQAASTKTIVGTAQSAGQFDTLVKLVTDAGLASTLSGKTKYTVFAPTDAAFAKVPKSTLDALAKDKQKLKAVLLYHVVKGSYPAAKVVKRSSLKTVEGSRLRVKVSGGKVTVGGARVTKPDIKASNGVIHVINKVLIPPS